MRKLLLLAAILGFALAVPGLATAAQEDCAADEEWNETTQQCEKKGG